MSYLSSDISSSMNNSSPTINPILKRRSSLYENERDLAASIITERILQRGTVCEYYDLSFDNDGDYLRVDRVFAERQDQYCIGFYDNLMIWCPELFQKESRIWTNFGIDSNDEYQVLIPKDHFEHIVAAKIPNIPQASDLLYVKPLNLWLEILNRDEGEISNGKQATYFQDKRYLWMLNCKIWTKVEWIGFTDDTKDTRLAKFIEQNHFKDKLDDSDTVDILKEPIEYEPKTNESPQQNPFVSY